MSAVTISLPMFWRFHDHRDGDACDCCAPQQQKGVVVKRRRAMSVTDDDRGRRTGGVSRRTMSISIPETRELLRPPIVTAKDGVKMEEPREPQQSPIDIHEAEADIEPIGHCTNAVAISMGTGEAEIDFDGHGVHVVWSAPGNNTLTIGDTVFHGVQFHFHTPSEHTLDGTHEELELHFVHRAADGSFAVLGVLFREGKTNAFLAQFWDKLDELEHDVPAKIPVGTINPNELDVSSCSLFRYRGSLTTPPYTEGVEWVIIHDVMEASREQLDIFHRALPGTNARDLQPLNHRHVTFAC